MDSGGADGILFPLIIDGPDNPPLSAHPELVEGWDGNRFPGILATSSGPSFNKFRMSGLNVIPILIG